MIYCVIQLDLLVHHSLVGDLLRRVGNVVHLGGEGVAGPPASRLAGRDFLHTHVGLLQRQALELGNQEEGEQPTEDAESAPEEEDLGAQVGLVLTDEVGSDDGYRTTWLVFRSYIDTSSGV
jgi:hypothetical protein